jgi:hypothetical protein
MIVRFPDGTAVQATGRGRPDGDPVPDFGLYLDPCWHYDNVSWEHTVLDWPDVGLPAQPAAARGAIIAAFDGARSGARVEVGCLGGSGRTGTVLGCMAVLAGVPAGDAVNWVRRNYRTGAVETAEQCRFVEEFGATGA